MPSFLDYYNDELRKRGAAPTSGSSLPSLPSSLKGVKFGGTQAPEENPFLGAGKWLLDIIDRPRNAIATVISEGLDNSKVVADAVIKDGPSGLLAGNPLGGAGALFKGLTSNDVRDKHSSSDIIEHATDLVGSYDPNYEDQQDNVNPVLKGILGFAGDVALDPLTYIPGGLLLKGAKAGVGAVDKGLTALSKAAVGAKDAEKAASTGEDVAAAAARAVQDEARPIKLEDFNADDLGMQFSMPTPAPKAQAEETLLNDVMMPASKSAPRAELKALEAAPERSQLGGTTPSPVASAEDLLSTLTKAPEAPRAQPEIPAEVLDGGAIPTGGRSLADTVAASEARTPIQEMLSQIVNTRQGQGAAVQSFSDWANALPKSTKIMGYGGNVRTMGQINELIARRNARLASHGANDGAFKALHGQLQTYTDALRKRYQDAQAVGGGHADNLGAFRAMLGANRAPVERAFGPDLTNYLSRQTSPAKFDKLLQTVKNVTDANPDVADTLRVADQNLSRLLSDRLGIPRLSKPSTPEEVAEYVDAAFRTNDVYTEKFSKGLQSAFADETLLKDFPYEVTKDGLKVRRTDLTPGAGQGRYVDQLNGFSQYTFMRHLTPAILEAADTILRAKGARRTFEGLYSEQRTEAFREATLRVLDHLNRVMDETGLQMSIGVGKETSMLSTSEVYRAMMAAAEEAGKARTIDQGLFNYGTAVAPTALTNAAAAAMHGANREAVLEILLDAQKYGKKGLTPSQDGKLLSGLVNNGHGWGSLSYSHLAGIVEELGQGRGLAKSLIRKKEQGRTSAATGAERGKTHYYIGYKSGGVNHMAEALADTIMDAKDALRIRAAENEAAFMARVGAETHQLSTEALQKINAVLADPTGIVAKTATLKGWKRATVEDAAAIAATPDSVSAAESLVEAGMGRELSRDIQTLQRASATAEKASSTTDLVKVSDEIVEPTWADVEDVVKRNGEYRPNEDIVDAEIVDDFPSVQDRMGDFNAPLDDLFAQAGEEAVQRARATSPAVDRSKDADKMVEAFGQRIQDPYSLLKHKVRTWFDQNYQAENVHPLFVKWQNSMAMRSSYINAQLNAINAVAARAGDVDGSLLRSAFANVQRGVASTNPASTEIEQMISGVLGDFFDLEAVGSLGNSFLRISGKTDAVNAMLHQKGLPEEFSFNPKDAMVGKTFDPTMLASQWKQWDVKDPLDFMHRMNLAREELAINAGTARSFVSLAKRLDAWSDVPKAGYVEITHSGKSRFGAHIPEGTYVKKELADELQMVETTLRTSREFQGELGNFIRTVYAPTLNAWKRTITIMRPGHHVRNYIGSTSATYVRRGANEFRRSHEDALKILGQRNNYEGVDMLGAAARDGISDLPQRGDTLLSLGSRGDLTVDEAYAFLADSGALPSFRVHEDFLSAEGGLNNLMHKLTLADTKVGKLAGNVSEYVDHFTRSQHFMQALRQDAKKYPTRSKERLMNDALKETLKYHPDASMLTPFESKLRLAIPFYTWFSKMMPALVESMVMHPGRVSMFNKASYNAAVAAGLNPMSLQDPFPDDQLFPSFIKVNPLGPQMSWGGSYVRVNPGFAHLDVMNTFGADPFRGLLGMTTPLVRVPIELMAGSSLQTGARINDKSDYLDQSIPFVNYLSNLTGTSVTGSVPSLLSGQGLDPQAGYQPKADGTTNKGDLDKGISALNWLTGLGFQNLSRPSYVNYAEIEKRNQAGGK